MADPVHALHNVAAAPKDPMFGLTAAYNADGSAQKVNLGVGAYKHVDGRPWVLPSVTQAKQRLAKLQDLNHEYLPIAGLKEFVEASQKLLLGSHCAALSQGRVASIQGLSGTGALSLATRFLETLLPSTTSKFVYVSQPPYINHIPIMREARLETGSYAYFSSQTSGLDFDGMMRDLNSIPDGSIILLHACAHNPTGVDPTKDQWRAICQLMKAKNMLPLLDSAYQGFELGDLDDDSWAVRHIVNAGFDAVLIAQFYAKNFGLYGERVGCLHLVAPSQSIASARLTQLERLQRITISTPPAYGARIVALILSNRDLALIW